MRPRWERTTRRDVHTVDVTAFLSLMVILVPFLLVTAVFSRTTILEVQKAGGEQAQESVQDPLQLRVTLRESVIEVNYAGLAQPLRIDRLTGAGELAPLAALARDLKSRNPDSLEATVLLEPQIQYDLLVQVLDTLRINLEQRDENVEQQFLFPKIALGLAPAAEQSGRSVP